MLYFSPVFTLDVAGFRKSDAHSEPNETSDMKFFEKTANF